mmetsp:Transcript_1751/g.3090  ORF Transcript_1751/g.3090 Transcript_1751/m.3090 type:complete len:98 (-) Transcript_1751:998-1291(-)
MSRLYSAADVCCCFGDRERGDGRRAQTATTFHSYIILISVLPSLYKQPANPKIESKQTTNTNLYICLSLDTVSLSLVLSCSIKNKVPFLSCPPACHP